LLVKYKVVGAVPTPMAVRRSNRWKYKGRQTWTRQNVAERSLRSVAEWCGVADAVAPTNAGSERVKMRNETTPKMCFLFLRGLFWRSWSVCGMEGGTTNWNSRTEQRERPERDRLIARDELELVYVF